MTGSNLEQPKSLESIAHIDPVDHMVPYSRRQFLKYVAGSVALGAAAGIATGTATKIAGDVLVDIITSAEQQIRKLELDLEVALGSLNSKYESQIEAFESYYTSGRLKIFEELGLANPKELQDLEKMLDRSKEFMDHYDFSERLSILKDRLDNRLINIADWIHSVRPKKGIDEWHKFVAGLFGKEIDTPQDEEARQAIRRRLGTLTAIYDANEDDYRAQIGVISQLNKYIALDNSLAPEELQLYIFLRDQFEKEGSDKGKLKDFILNYDNFDGREILLLNVRQFITELDSTYNSLVQSKNDLDKLQDLLEEGIKLKEKVRATAPEEFNEQYGKQMQSVVDEFKKEVYGVIKEIKEKGYEVETREDFIKSGPLTREARSFVNPLAIYAGVAVGLYATARNGVISLIHGRTKRKAKASAAAYEDAVRQYNDLADRYNNLTTNTQIDEVQPKDEN